MLNEFLRSGESISKKAQTPNYSSMERIPEKRGFKAFFESKERPLSSK